MIGRTATLVFTASAALGTTSLAVLNVVFIPQIYPMDPVATALSEDAVPAVIVAPSRTFMPAEPARLAALGDNVGGDTVAGDNVAGNSAAGDSAAGDNVAGDNVAGDNVAGEVDTSTDTGSVEVDATDTDTPYVVNFPRARRRPQRATATLEAALASYGAQSGPTMVIVGHADARGADVSNLDLSRERAEFVASWMRERGVRDSAISISYHGEGRPVDHRRGATADARNRRVEIEIRRGRR